MGGNSLLTGVSKHMWCRLLFLLFRFRSLLVTGGNEGGMCEALKFPILSVDWDKVMIVLDFLLFELCKVQHAAVKHRDNGAWEVHTPC